jgi:hypothetical protein
MFYWKKERGSIKRAKWTRHLSRVSQNISFFVVVISRYASPFTHAAFQWDFIEAKTIIQILIDLMERDAMFKAHRHGFFNVCIVRHDLCQMELSNVCPTNQLEPIERLRNLVFFFPLALTEKNKFHLTRLHCSHCDKLITFD